MESALRAKGREEVRYAKPEMVIARIRLQSQNPCSCVCELRSVPTSVHVCFANRIDVHTRTKGPVSGVVDFEAIQCIERILLASAGNVQLTGSVLYDTR